MILDYLDGHDILMLMSSGSKRLSKKAQASIRHFRIMLKHIEKFPFYAFNFASLSEIGVILHEESVDYPVECNRRVLLPSKPLTSLKKLSFDFLQSSSILAHGDQLSQIFPSLTDLSLTRGIFVLTKQHLEALPSTLRRFHLEDSISRISSPESGPINITLLSKLSQNLELLNLGNILVVLEEHESLERFQFSDSLLDLRLTHLQVPQLITKLPAFVQRVEIGFDIGTNEMEDAIPISSLPRTLRVFDITHYDEMIQFTVDGPFPPQIQKFYARVDNWASLPPNFISFPDSLRSLSRPSLEVFGENLERAPPSLEYLSALETHLTTAQAEHFPISLGSLSMQSFDANVLLMLPKSLTLLHLDSNQSDQVGILTRAVCERLQTLEAIECYLHHFETSSCLSSLKCIQRLTMSVNEGHLSSEELLFTHLTSNNLQELSLHISTPSQSVCTWPIWLSQLQNHDSIHTLSCSVNTWIANDANEEGEQDEIDLSKDSNPTWGTVSQIPTIPEYLKCLPPKLESLYIHPPLLPQYQAKAAPIISSPEFLDCFRHFPATLNSLIFADTPIDPSTFDQDVLWLSDECFTHLPPSLTQLEVLNVLGLTERFWDIIPPYVKSINIKIPNRQCEPIFRERQSEYLSKFGASM